MNPHPNSGGHTAGHYPSQGDKPHHSPHNHQSEEAAINMVRSKIEALYSRMQESEHQPTHHSHANHNHQTHHQSKHQHYLQQLTSSGLPMAEIQARWGDYYTKLPDHEKHQIWQEFYNSNARKRTVEDPANLPQIADSPIIKMSESGQHHPVVVSHEDHSTIKESLANSASIGVIKEKILKNVKLSGRTKVRAKQHLQSLAFGLSLGTLTLVIFLFGLFNQMVIAPFIKPSSRVESTPIILNSNSPAPSELPELIIPKINVQLPVVYDVDSLAEPDVQKALERGVFHYPTTSLPGQNGNVAIFGHSSNNIFNKGSYKFAFVLLRELEPGDIFYLTQDNQVFTYKVYGKKVVSPNDTWVLGPAEGKSATVALITCDPPGTTLKRLVVWGEQIGPDPHTNIAASEPSPNLDDQALPADGPGPWTRFWRWLF